MKVKDVIKLLQDNYFDDEHIICVWWDKVAFDGYLPNDEEPEGDVPTAYWNVVAEQYEMPDHLVSLVHDDIVEVLRNDKGGDA